MKSTKYIITLFLLSYWAYFSVLILHESYLINEYLGELSVSIKKEKENQNENNLEQSAKLLCVERQDFQKNYFERRNPLLKQWTEQENTQKYGNSLGLSYEYLYIEWLEEGFEVAEINNKIISKITEIPQKMNKKAREILILGVFLLIVYLAGEFYNLYKTENRRKKLRFFKSLGLFLGAVLGGYLAMLLTIYLHNFVILCALISIPLLAFLGEKIGLMIFNAMKK